MKVGFDLDGTLDRPSVRDLALALIAAGHEVHIITGIFSESGSWQDLHSKIQKLDRLGIPNEYYDDGKCPKCGSGEGFNIVNAEPGEKTAHLHTLYAMPDTYSRDYRLADMGLRKGALCEKLGITLFFDDSEDYVKMIPKMSGGTTVLHVR